MSDETFDRLGAMHTRLGIMEETAEGMRRALDRMDDKWQRSVDDIKATIKAEVSELKTEQIADLKARIADGYRTLQDFETRLRAVEVRQNAYDTAGGVVNWLIRVALGILGLLAGAFGWEHFRH